MSLQLHRPLTIPERIREAGGVKVLVLSEAEALALVPETPTLFISITDPGRNNLPDFAPHYFLTGVLRIAFHDREVPRFGFQLMQEAQAQEVWEAVKRLRNEYKQIVVHCWAGRCRSSAVAWAIASWLGDDKAGDFYPEHFEPNQHVYQTMKAARQLRLS